jgi:hypothetical protein
VRSTLKEIREVSRAGDEAVVEVTDALGHKERTRMKKVDGRWLVDGAVAGAGAGAGAAGPSAP